jgi:hypothetical protein
LYIPKKPGKERWISIPEDHERRRQKGTTTNLKVRDWSRGETKMDPMTTRVKWVQMILFVSRLEDEWGRERGANEPTGVDRIDSEHEDSQAASIRLQGQEERVVSGSHQRR